MSDWHGLYGEGWQNEIVGKAFSHPAKFARGLIRRIYEHAIEEGWLVEGDTAVDPFAGVALGGLDAMFHGLHWIGYELEDKFVGLGGQNIALWNSRYGNGMLPRWGTAVILQGDSRYLVDVLDGARAKGIVASPPYAGARIQQEGSSNADNMRRNNDRDRYGTNPANLGNMREGDHVKACISSPPYANRRPEASGGGVDLEKQYETYRSQGGGASFEKFCHTQQSHSQNYGSSPGQLAAMPEGDVDAVISSPPFVDAGTHQASNEADERELRLSKERRTGPGGRIGISQTTGYGQSPGQLATLPEGDVRAVVSSPPWMETNNQFSSNTGARQAIGDWADKKVEYAESRVDLRNEFAYMSPEWLERRKETAQNQNLSRLPAEAKDPDYPTFWSAAKQIVSQCYQVLAPGGHAIWVVKDFVRNKQIVPFCEQWRELCESCGFETLHKHRCWLVEDRGGQYALNGDLVERKVERKSFFRRLYEKKYPENSIDYEVVWCMRKPADAPLFADVAVREGA